MVEKLRGDELLNHVVDKLARSGSDLGTGVQGRNLGPQRGSLDDSIGLPPNWKPSHPERVMLDVAMSKASERENRDSFVSRFVKAGFMLADPHGPNAANNRVQMAQMKAAPTDELQTVMRATADRRGAIEMKEVRLRVDEIVRLRPKDIEEMVARDPSGSREKAIEGLVARVAKANFSEQQKWSTDPATGTFPSLDKSDRTSLRALSRGFKAIEGELKERGIEPDVMLKGKVLNRGKTSDVAEVAPRRRMIRDGFEV
jgi:hypothetical protein